MTTKPLLLAAALGFALAACGGQQQAEGTAAESAPAAGEMPQAGDTGTVTGSPATDTIGTDSTGASTSADAGAMGDLQSQGTTGVTTDAGAGVDGTTDPNRPSDTTGTGQPTTPPPPTQ